MSEDDLPSVAAAPGTELATIQETLRTQPAVYFRDEGMQQRYFDLLQVETGEKPSAGRPSAGDREIAKIREIMRTDSWRYWRDEEMQARYLALLEAKERGETDASEPGTDPARLTGLRTVTEVRREVEANGDWENFELGFDIMPEAVHRVIESELVYPTAPLRLASDEALQRFATLPEQAELVREWGAEASRKLAWVTSRAEAIFDRLSFDDYTYLSHWWNVIAPPERKAVLRALAR